MLLVLMQIGPPRPHVLSRLTTSHPSVGGLFIDAFTLFPQSLFGLAVPDLGAWLGVSEFKLTHMRCINH
jgi:hypothetical protein